MSLALLAFASALTWAAVDRPTATTPRDCVGYLVVNAELSIWTAYREFEITGVPPRDRAVRGLVRLLHRDVKAYQRRHGPFTVTPPGWLRDAYVDYLNGKVSPDPVTRGGVLRMMAADSTLDPRGSPGDLAVELDQVPAWLWARYDVFLNDDASFQPFEIKALRRLHRAVRAARLKPVEQE